MGLQVKIASGLNVLLSAWLIGAPFMLQYQGQTAEVWNEIIVGSIVLILAAIRVFNPMRFRWMSWVNAVLGLWLAVSPIAVGAGGNGIILVNDMLVGAGFAAFGIWSAYASRAPTAP